MTNTASKREIAGLIDGRSVSARIGAATGIYLLLLGVLYVHLVVWPQEYSEGQIVPFTVFSPIEFPYEDSQLLEQLTGKAAENENLYIIDPQVRQFALQDFDKFRRDFGKLRSAASGKSLNDPDLRDSIVELSESSGIESRLVESFLIFTDEHLEQSFTAASKALGTHMSGRVSQETIDALQQGGLKVILEHPADIYVFFMKPNIKEYRPPAINEEFKELATTLIPKGSVIIAEGQMVDRRAADQLAQLQPMLHDHNLKRFLGLALLALLLYVLLFFCMLLANVRLLGRAGPIVQLGGLMVLLLLVGLLIGRAPQNYFFYGVTFAVSALATLVVLLHRPVLAVYFGLALGLLISMALNFEADLMLYTLAAALLPAVAITSEANLRRQVVFAFGLGLFNVALALTVVLVSVQTLHWMAFVVAFLAGFLAAVVAQGMLPVMEYFSSQLTPGKLSDLANHENELLKRLKREAIGTYAHSVMVADLAEEACRDIEADWLKAKVGALYHDIGKLKRPGFFAENIHDLSKNPHDQLPPETSIKILKDHVNEGHAMAKHAGLPRDLHSFILEHHGTYLIKYFYYRALNAHQANPEESPEPDYNQFCYGGPIPQSRESGVVMLADITEAVTRSIPAASGEEIVRIVNSIVAEKIEEGQLGDSSLTIGDLEKVRQAFIRVLAAQRHQRVTYPDKAPAPLQFYYLPRDTETKSQDRNESDKKSQGRK